ncbi:MAG: polyisoprenoid-binding protein [Candidatus Omnitrophica bacterium]|nr:polyisoprenoid-binding protein [Candidatus Omnitrophota bacterium]
MKRFSAFPVLTLGLVFLSTAASAATFKVDPDHTTVSFKIRHLFSQVQGEFTEFEGAFDYDAAKPEAWKANGTIKAASINTRVPERDKHLRSADFFDAEKFPTITFKSAKFTDVTAEHAKMEGALAIHGVEKPVTLDVEIHGVGKDPWGNVRAGFTAKTTIDRRDFGLKWNEALETGKFLVGDEVVITLEVEGIQQ